MLAKVQSMINAWLLLLDSMNSRSLLLQMSLRPWQSFLCIIEKPSIRSLRINVQSCLLEVPLLSSYATMSESDDINLYLDCDHAKLQENIEKLQNIKSHLLQAFSEWHQLNGTGVDISAEYPRVDDISHEKLTIVADVSRGLELLRKLPASVPRGVRDNIRELHSFFTQDLYSALAELQDPITILTEYDRVYWPAVISPDSIPALANTLHWNGKDRKATLAQLKQMLDVAKDRIIPNNDASQDHQQGDTSTEEQTRMVPADSKMAEVPILPEEFFDNLGRLETAITVVKSMKKDESGQWVNHAQQADILTTEDGTMTYDDENSGDVDEAQDDMDDDQQGKHVRRCDAQSS